MNIESLQDELETEKEHTKFLEKLLKTLCGNGWEQLTIAMARDLKVVPKQPAPCKWCETIDADHQHYCSWCGRNLYPYK